MEEFAIKFQDGPLKDGRNGLTVEEAIAEVAKRIWFYNSKVPCKENEQAIVALNDALYYLEQRTKDRSIDKPMGCSAAGYAASARLSRSIRSMPDILA